MNRVLITVGSRRDGNGKRITTVVGTEVGNDEGKRRWEFLGSSAVQTGIPTHCLVIDDRTV